MKRILIASALALAAGGQALAADLPPPAPMPRAPATYVPVAAPYYNWTGFYIGGNLGGGFTNGNFNSNIAGAPLRRQRAPPSSAAARSAPTTSSGAVSWSVRRRCSIGFPTPKTPLRSNASAAGVPVRHRDDQQSMADNRDRQARLRLGSRAALRQGRRRLGRGEQFRDYGNRRRPVAFSGPQQHFWLDRGRRCRVGFLGQLVGPRRVRLYRAEQRDLYDQLPCTGFRGATSAPAAATSNWSPPA